MAGMVKQMGHCDPMTQVQLELYVETRFVTATLLLEHLHTEQEVL